MRHLAWLHAVPEKKEESRLKSLKATDEDSFLLKMPEIGEAEYLVTLLFEAGLVEQAGTGITALSWKEIDSWLNRTELHLEVWEVLTLRQMSEAYASEFSQASKPDRPAPYTHIVEADEINREAVASKLKSAFASLRKK